ncbi:hypothetical protein BDV24DRAFT_173954 [Aspergillus arachidicola]|uniref:Dynamin GTPase domain-containing protein n=1 Tax=Aspergillus arachidicola TaxID=656916 RepID=A0A5N6XLN6_9EURO|nr:hypothetical protein BDV24DRAFT_173954 [Aspergillus arachidicola]
METPPDKDWVALDLDRVGGSLGLQTSRTSEKLNQIDRIRANGVGDHIALPQLAVCGDQSAGKCSVLEGITGIPFPRQDGLCKRFATEISLRHEPGEQRATAMIIPHVSRSEEEKVRLGAFRHQIQDFAELPSIIERVSELMGLRGHATDLSAPAFSADILRLELVGNTGLHLNIVDLPGLISVSENEDDIKLVKDLVDSYLENSRTMILAVVPASSDVDTQGIIQRAHHFDKAGCRTVGIITKPDLINNGTESRIARLAKNLDGITLAGRRKAELEFFSAGPWKAQGIDPSRIGIDNLRIFLQELLDSHIERELPKVHEDVRSLLNNLNDELASLGEERSSPNQIRVYLTRVSSDFHNLIKAGVEGDYTGRDASFFIIDGENMYVRLRAAIHQENETFSSYMRTNKTNAEAEEGQILLTDEQLMSWIKQKYQETRGRELPGNHNYALLAELYHAQSERWGSIGRKHVDKIVLLVSQFVSHALKFVVKDPKVCDSASKVVNAALEVDTQYAHEELQKLLQDETRQPITYNHYYTDNIQEARLDRSKQQLADSLTAAIENDWNGTFQFQNSSKDIRRLTSSLQERIVVNMTEQACIEARNDLGSYY